MEVYERERRLSKKEKKLLALYLAYPDGLAQLLRQYRKPGGIAEAEAVRRLRKELDRIRGVRETMGELWPKRPVNKGGSQTIQSKEGMAVAALHSRAGKEARDDKKGDG